MPTVAKITDLATPRLKAILAALAPAQRKAMLQRLGKELERQLKAHFLQRENDSPNKRGFPRSHFWIREVRGKTALRSVTADLAIVGIDSPAFASKLKRTTITARPGGALAIPVRAEVYGKLARTDPVPGLFPIAARGRAWLASTIAEGPGGPLRVYYRLLRSVTIEADTRALPPVGQLQAALEARAELEIKRILQQTK